jgi:uridine kinase
VNTRRLSLDDTASLAACPAPPAASVVAPVIVGVAGGSGSGKTCIATLISESLQGVRVVSISSDSYYKGLEPGANAAERNWDHPNALDLDLLAARTFQREPPRASKARAPKKQTRTQTLPPPKL